MMPPQTKPSLETMKKPKAKGRLKNKSFPGTSEKERFFIADLKTQMKARG